MIHILIYIIIFHYIKIDATVSIISQLLVKTIQQLVYLIS